MSIDHDQKNKYLKYFSEFLDIKNEQSGNIKQFPKFIWDYTTDYSKVNWFKSYDALVNQRENNTRIVWNELGSSVMLTYTYLESAYAWLELLNRYIDIQGLKTENNEFLSDHLVLVANQDQLNIIYELMPEINSAIIGLVSTKDWISNILVRTFNNLFIDYNRIVFIDSIKQEKQFKSQINPGEIIKVLLNANQKNPVFKDLLILLNFFRTDEWMKLEEYRHDLIHKFGQGVGVVRQGIQIIKEEKNAEGQLSSESMAFGITKAQKWKHKELVLLTIKVWNDTINQIELIFEELTKNISDKAFEKLVSK